jgi:hypothetical protein
VDWSLDVTQKRSLLHSMSEILSSDNQNSVALSFLIKYFKTFSGEPLPSEVEIVAQSAVVSAIKSPVASYADRSALLQVQSASFPLRISF